MAGPVPVHRFDQLITGIVEVEPDVFIVGPPDGSTTHESHPVRIDFNGWTPGEPAALEIVFTFGDRVRALNSSCLLGPGVPAIAEAGGAEFVAAIDIADDFCVDEDAGFAYVTRHRANTLDRVPLRPRHGSEVRHLAGDPFDEVLARPSGAVWGRGSGDDGRVMYVTTDGGTTAAPDGVFRKAALPRIVLSPRAGS
jgi:hypothetical protein